MKEGKIPLKANEPELTPNRGDSGMGLRLVLDLEPGEQADTHEQKGR